MRTIYHLCNSYDAIEWTKDVVTLFFESIILPCPLCVQKVATELLLVNTLATDNILTSNAKFTHKIHTHTHTHVRLRKRKEANFEKNLWRKLDEWHERPGSPGDRVIGLGQTLEIELSHKFRLILCSDSLSAFTPWTPG